MFQIILFNKGTFVPLNVVLRVIKRVVLFIILDFVVLLQLEKSLCYVIGVLVIILSI